MQPEPLTKEQFALWHAEYTTLMRQMRFNPPLDRERTMLYLLERILLRVRLSVGLGDPGNAQHPIPSSTTKDHANQNPQPPNTEDSQTPRPPKLA